MAHSTSSNGRPETSRQIRRHIGATIHAAPTTGPYGILWARLCSLGFGGGGNLRSIGLTSSRRHEGVTTVACNLALYAASRADLRVLLIDANHPYPMLHRIFQLAPTPGLADLVSGEAPISDCVRDMSSRPLAAWPTSLAHSFRRNSGLSRLVGRRRQQPAPPQLSVMTSGNSRMVVGGRTVSQDDQWLELAADSFDLVVVDLPACGSLTQCGFKQSKLDGVLLVLQAESTPDNTARKSLDQLRNDDVNLLGVAFNKCKKHLPNWIEKKLGD